MGFWGEGIYLTKPTVNSKQVCPQTNFATASHRTVLVTARGRSELKVTARSEWRPSKETLIWGEVGQHNTSPGTNAPAPFPFDNNFQKGVSTSLLLAFNLLEHLKRCVDIHSRPCLQHGFWLRVNMQRGRIDADSSIFFFLTLLGESSQYIESSGNKNNFPPFPKIV